jgi:hypothetical protein
MSVKETAATAREKALEAYDNARESAANAGRKAGDGIDQAPLVALAGGLAIGALIAALLPKTAKESELLGGVGERLTGTARTAAEAAKDAGKARLEELGLTRDAGAETLKSILKGAGDATKASAQAALSAVRDKK